QRLAAQADLMAQGVGRKTDDGHGGSDSQALQPGSRFGISLGRERCGGGDRRRSRVGLHAAKARKRESKIQTTKALIRNGNRWRALPRCCAAPTRLKIESLLRFGVWC